MQIKCPQCGKPAIYDSSNQWRPFCSERCRLIDFGEWIEGNNRISADESPDTEQSNHLSHLKH